MIDSFSLQQQQETSNLDVALISRQYKLNFKPDFMRMKYENPKLKQTQIATQICYTTNTLQRYRDGIQKHRF